jgi:WD40 repeat protein
MQTHHPPPLPNNTNPLSMNKTKDNEEKEICWGPHQDKEVLDVAWNRHDQSIVASVGGKSVFCHIIGGDRLTVMGHILSNTGNMRQCIFDPNPSKKLLALSDGSLRMCDIHGNILNVIAENNTNEVEFLYAAWHPHGNMIISVLSDDSVSLYDIRKAGQIQSHTFPSYLNEVQWVDANTFAIARCVSKTGMGQVDFFSVSDFHQPIRSIRAHTQSCSVVQFWSSSPSNSTTSPNDSSSHHHNTGGNNIFAVGSEDSLVTLWDTKTFLCRGTIDRFDVPIGKVQFSADGTTLATIQAGNNKGDRERERKLTGGAMPDKFIDFTDVDTLKQVATLRYYADLESGCFHPNNKSYFLVGINNRNLQSAEIGLYKLGGELGGGLGSGL